MPPCVTLITQLPSVAAVTVTLVVTVIAESVTHGPDETWKGAFDRSSVAIIITDGSPTDGNVIGPL